MLLSRALRAALPRRGGFERVSSADIEAFQKIVGQQYVKTNEIEQFCTDWTGQMKGDGSCVVLPSSTQEVSSILTHCKNRKLPVVVQGGNTGLVGGATPVFDELIVSTKRLNKHFHLDEASGVLSVDAGFVLEDIDNRLAEHGYMMPLDLGSRGSCQIGGCLSAGAGGIRLLRYGSLHSHVLGLTAVDGAGRILELGGQLRKDNTSLHTPHLFIGGEGQLGIVSRVTMTVVPRPSSVHVAMLALPSFDNCLRLLRLAKRHLGEILSSFELIDQATMESLERNLSMTGVLPTSPFTILVESSGSNYDHDEQKMAAFLEGALTEGIAVDGALAGSDKERTYMWSLREHAPIATKEDGYIYKYDISLPLRHFYTSAEETRTRFGATAKVYGYGHMMDGNIHINVTTPKLDPAIADNLAPWLYKWVVEHGGSISAEHGIGQLKREYRHLGKSEEEARLVRAIKAVFDPEGILCPYKMLHA